MHCIVRGAEQGVVGGWGPSYVDSWVLPKAHVCRGACTSPHTMQVGHDKVWASNRRVRGALCVASLHVPLSPSAETLRELRATEPSSQPDNGPARRQPAARHHTIYSLSATHLEPGCQAQGRQVRELAAPRQRLGGGTWVGACRGHVHIATAGSAVRFNMLCSHRTRTGQHVGWRRNITGASSSTHINTGRPPLTHTCSRRWSSSSCGKDWTRTYMSRKVVLFSTPTVYRSLPLPQQASRVVYC